MTEQHRPHPSTPLEDRPYRPSQQSQPLGEPRLEDFTYPELQPEKRRVRPWLVTVVGILALAVIVVGSIFAFSLVSDHSDDTSETEQSVDSAKKKMTVPVKYGHWEGQTIADVPDGQGTMYFDQQCLVSPFDPAHTVAKPGEYVIGEYSSGRLVQGTLYRLDGTTLYINAAH